MKYLFRLLILILIYYLTNMLYIKQSIAQDWPCGNPAAYNINIPNDNSTVYLSENSVAVHPNYPNIILSANNYSYPPNVSAFVSTNWGNNWFSPFNNGIFDVQSWCDPAAAIDLNGRLYVSYLGTGGPMKVAYSDNLGSNWTVITVYGGIGIDKDHLHIDNSCSSPYKGRLYCAWTQNYNNIYISYSDNGTNWSTPTIISGSSNIVSGVNIATDNSGNVYVVWAKYYSLNEWNVIGINKSTNGGVNWSNTPFPFTFNTYMSYYASISASGVGPSLTVNMQDNTLYLVYSANAGSPAFNDVFLKKSTNGGINWSDAGTVNQGTAGHQTFPWISCDPMSGYLACIYYDTRNDDKYTYLSISTNSGSSWCDMQISNLAWNGGGAGIGHDYIGVEFNKGIIYPIWTDTRVGDGQFRTYTYPYDAIQRDLTIHDQSYNNTAIIQSANSITAYNITINSGATVKFQTVKTIILEPGFYANEGCNFIAEFLYCQPGTFDTKGKLVFNEENKLTSTKEKDNSIPNEFSLSQNYPNPFNSSTIIKYALKKDVNVSINIHNILGQKVKALVDEYQNAGYKSIIWDGTNDNGKAVSSGIYIYKLIAGDFIDKKKMALIK